MLSKPVDPLKGSPLARVIPSGRTISFNEGQYANTRPLIW